MKQSLKTVFQIACAIALAVVGFVAILIMAALQYALQITAIIAILYAVKRFFF